MRLDRLGNWDFLLLVDKASWKPASLDDLTEESWQAITRNADLYFMGNDITDPERKKSLFLYKTDIEIQELFSKLKEIRQNTEGEELDSYTACITTLNKHFSRSSNKFHERHILRQLKQGQDESIERFVARLRSQASKCKYGDSILEEEILQQLITGGRCEKLRTKLLTNESTLDEAIVLGKTLDRVQDQLKDFQPESKAVAVVQSSSRKFNPIPRSDNRSCFDCGHYDHLSKNPKCRALNHKCKNCGKVGHFEKFCRKRNWEAASSRYEPHSKKAKHVNMVEDHTEDSTKDYFSFFLGARANQLRFIVGGVEINLCVDSGSDVSLLRYETFQHLQKSGAQFTMQEECMNKDLGGIASGSKLEIQKVIMAQVRTDNLATVEKFYVVANANTDLLCSDAAKSLAVLKVGLQINQVEAKKPFPMLKGCEVKLYVDPSVRPVVQKLRKVALELEPILEEKMKELLQQDIIEKVFEPAKYVSSVVLIKKSNGEYRFCVDFRPFNKAIRTQGYKMPDVETFLTTLPKGVKFSKFDFTNAFFMLPLVEDSRHYTTFIVKGGLYRFKRLPMGLKCAPEEFQKRMDQLFADLDKVNM